MTVAYNRLDVLGDTYGRLTVVGEGSKVGKHRRVIARCLCGATVEVRLRSLRSGQTRSCGCLGRDLSATRKSQLIHGHAAARTATYRSWMSMRERCLNANAKAYARYGGRGLSICSRWNDFALFLEDMGPRPVGTTLDRIDFDGNYEPDNCRWAEHLVQARNKRSVVLDVDQVADIRFLIEEGQSRQMLAAAFGVSVYTVHDVAARASWQEIEASKPRYIGGMAA